MDNKIGIRLRHLRNELGLTQEETAEKIGISRARYSHFENGRNEPDNKMLVSLADFFNVTVDYLLGENNSSNDLNVKPQVKRLARKMDSMNEDDLKFVNNLLDRLEGKTSGKD